MKRRVVTLLLALALVAAWLPGLAAPASAATLTGYIGTQDVRRGSWTYEEDTKTLTVEGDEEPYGSFYYDDGTPFDRKDEVVKVVVKEGMTHLFSIFEQMHAMKEIVLPNSLRIIDQPALAYCTSLEEITIPAGVELIGDMNLAGSEGICAVFMGCTALKHIWVDPANTHYSSDSYGVLFNKDQTILKYCPIGLAGHYIAPETLRNVHDSAFWNADQIVKITLPEGMTEIGTLGSWAMSGDHLASVNLPSTLETIGDGCFNGTKLTEVVIPASVTRIENAAFASCRELRVVTILNKDCVIEQGKEEPAGWKTFTNPRKVTLVGYPGSTTQAFAEQYGYRFEDLTQKWDNPFTDIKEGSWFYSSVQYVEKNGLFKGVEENYFDPAAPMNRAMFAVVLYRLAGCPEFAGSSSFQDVPEDSYFATAVAWAEHNGLINGIGDGLFGAGNPISRQDIVTLLYRYAKFAGLDTRTDDSLAVLRNAFTDEDEILDYAKEAFSWALNKALIQGIPNDGRMELTLAPGKSANRAEVAKLVAGFDRSFLDRNSED